jgi:diguanylate cyclase (GGDEF)-like protein
MNPELAPDSRNGDSFRARALAFAAGAGAVVLILTLLATGVDQLVVSNDATARQMGFNAMILCVIASGVTAVAVQRALEPIALALDTIIAQLKTATIGDFSAQFPRSAYQLLPVLVGSLDVLLARVRSNLEATRRVALQDPVTDLPNRTSFRQQAEQKIGRAAVAKRGGALLLLDIDRFSAINDSLGHTQGDVLLAAFAERLRTVVEAQGGLAGRLAGDSFTVLLPEVETRTQAEVSTRRLLRMLDEPFSIAGHRFVVSASAGVAMYPADGDGFSALMRSADLAMLEAKQRSRGGFRFHDAAQLGPSEDRLLLEQQLREALQLHQFELHYQPIARASDNAVVAAEALIRWRHPSGELRAPATFIHVAEESGLIVEVGRWVIEQTARQIAQWQKAGRALRVSLNVSPLQLARADFARHIEKTLRAYGVPFDGIELEITESMMMTGDRASIERLAGLRALGVSVAIDDFGTGYSNLARLRELPVDRLKIDRSLIADICVSAEARAIVGAIVALGQGLSLECLAEGVETRAQADTLAEMGCDLLQGYLIARPDAPELLMPRLRAVA